MELASCSWFISYVKDRIPLAVEFEAIDHCPRQHLVVGPDVALVEAIEIRLITKTAVLLG